MKILLYSPDNGVTRNFMQHLWMFLLQSLTPAGHEVLLIDGNAQADGRSTAWCVSSVNKILGWSESGRMTEMDREGVSPIADVIRAMGVPVVMGGPHVTEMADEALGRSGGGRAIQTQWLLVKRMKLGQGLSKIRTGALKEIYAPVDDFGQERKPSLQSYPAIPWDKINLEQFNLVPRIATRILQHLGGGWGT